MANNGSIVVSIIEAGFSLCLEWKLNGDFTQTNRPSLVQAECCVMGGDTLFTLVAHLWVQLSQSHPEMRP